MVNGENGTMDIQTAKCKSEINITVEVTSETIDGQTLQHALYKPAPAWLRPCANILMQN